MTPIDILRAQPRDFIARFAQILRDNADRQTTGTLFQKTAKGLCMCAAGALVITDHPDAAYDWGRKDGYSWEVVATALPVPPAAGDINAPIHLYEFIYTLNDTTPPLPFPEIADLIEKLVDSPIQFIIDDRGIVFGDEVVMPLSGYLKPEEMRGSCLARVVRSLYREGKL